MSFLTKTKSKIISLSDLDKLLNSGDVYIYSIHVTSIKNNYIFYLYNDFFQYVAECRNLTSLDIRMIRKIYTNLYYYNDEFSEISKVFG